MKINKFQLHKILRQGNFFQLHKSNREIKHRINDEINGVFNVPIKNRDQKYNIKYRRICNEKK